MPLNDAGDAAKADFADVGHTLEKRIMQLEAELTLERARSAETSAALAKSVPALSYKYLISLKPERCRLCTAATRLRSHWKPFSQGPTCFTALPSSLAVVGTPHPLTRTLGCFRVVVMPPASGESSTQAECRIRQLE